MTKENETSGKNSPVALIALIGLSFVVGVLWQKVSALEGGTLSTKPQGGQQQVDPADPNALGQPQARPANGKMDEARVASIVMPTDDDNIYGSKDAKVFLIEYSDFECPYCQSFHATAKKVVDESNGEIAWVYRHYPLDQIHPKARPAAIASECIAELGGNNAFWKFADYVLESSASQRDRLADLSEAAVAAGVNQSAFENCVSDNDYEDLVNTQMQDASKLGVTGTPGNILVTADGKNGWFVPGAFPYDQLKPYVDEALQAN